MSQLLNQMDEHLSNKPFKRCWWSRRWIVHMSIQPPLSKEYPLWKRSQDELRLLRLFDLSPEALGRKIERYWKKPRWRRWFSSFGMNKKIDIWNYYHRCLAYQAVRPNKLESQSVMIASGNRSLLNALGLVLHQFNIKFERYLEKRCRNPNWIEKNFLKEIKLYQQQLKRTFLTNLNKSLRQKTESNQFTLKQQAEQEYQQAEAFMLCYFERRLNTFFPDIPRNHFIELKANVAQEGNTASPENNIAIYRPRETIFPSCESTLPKSMERHVGIVSLRRAKEWIQDQRKRLNSLMEEGSPQKVQELLQSCLQEIKTITELHLRGCEAMISDIQGKYEDYTACLEYLDKLQNELKPLLQGGMLLFHPDHVMTVTHSQTMWELINHYSQSHTEQSRYYVDRLKDYPLRIEKLYKHSQKELQAQQSRAYWSDLARDINELGKSVKDLEQSLKELDKKMTEDTKEFWYKMYTKWEQAKAEMDAKRVQDKAEMDAKLKQSETERMQAKAEMDAKLLAAKEESDANMKKILDLIQSQQPASVASASNTETLESSLNNVLSPSKSR